MKVLVLNGSPKKEASDTMHITRAFLEGMECEATIINVVEKNIGYCRGCFTCKKNGGECVLNDDMKEILDDILKSDLLIFSFPLYSYSMPSQLKALIDRTMPLSSLKMVSVGDHYEHPCQHDFSKIRYIMISGCGFPNSKHNFDAMEMQFKFLFGDDVTIVSVPESPMFNAPIADEVTKPFLEIVKKAGSEYQKNGFISKETQDKLAIPMIPDDVYASICNQS